MDIQEGPGFDLCGALLSTADMNTWFNDSPYYWEGVYIGGDNLAGCAEPTSSWVNTVTGQGWGLLPIWVGPQDPCWGYSGTKFSITPSVAFAAGESAAVNAYVALGSDGFDPSVGGNAIIIYDLEAYSDFTKHTLSQCIAAAQSFISGWDTALRLPPNQYVGTYGSVCGSQLASLASITSPPYSIWGAEYPPPVDSNPSDMDCVPSGDWSGEQRQKQWDDDVASGMYGDVPPQTIDLDQSNGPVYY